MPSPVRAEILGPVTRAEAPPAPVQARPQAPALIPATPPATSWAAAITQPVAQPVVQPVVPGPSPASVPPATPATPGPSLSALTPAAAAVAAPGEAVGAQPAGSLPIGAAPSSTLSAGATGPVLGSALPRVELPSSQADGLNNPKPAYPLLSRRLGEQGQVIVRVLIATDGTAQRAELRQSSGSERLDQAALSTVLKWRYVPGRRGGVPEAMWFNVPINFVLE